jgi:ABC-type Na+ efflux pump permease subunit
MVSMGSALLTVMSVIPAGLIAANALVGERESKTLEPLLCTPLTDRELILGKTLSSLLPCLAILFGGTLASAIGVNIIMIVTGNNLVLFPDLPGMFLIFAAGPVVILAVVSTMILVSGKVSRVYEAYQTGSVASLVLFIPIFGPFALIESTEPNPSFILLVNMVTFLIATVLASVTWTLALKRFNRDTMVSLV